MNTLKDPVCGMDVDETDLKHSHEGRDYFFCNPRCAEKFKAAPARYIGGKAVADALKVQAAKKY